jgi:hypothetical protein
MKKKSISNNNNFKTQIARKKLFESYCKHISSGFSDDSFPDCDIKTFNSVLQQYPEDFPAEKIDKAKRLCLKFWEEKGMGNLTEDGKPYNPTMWIFNMKNRFGWKDRPESINKENDEDKTVEVEIVKE